MVLLISEIEIPENIIDYLKNQNLQLDLFHIIKDGFEKGIPLRKISRENYPQNASKLTFDQFYERLRHIIRYLALGIIQDNRKPIIRPSSLLTTKKMENLDFLDGLSIEKQRRLNLIS